MTVYYLDPSRSTNGTGTQLNPYNTFSSFTDVNNNTLLIKAGTTIRQALVLNGRSGFTIGAYGTGHRPLILGSVILTVPWQQDATGWYIAVDNDGNPFANVQALYADGVRLICYGTAEDMNTNAPAMFAVGAGLSAPSRIYVNLGGANPNHSVFEITKRKTCIELINCSNFTLTDVWMKYAYGNNLWIYQGLNNGVISGNKSEYAGGWDYQANTGGNACMSIQGASGASKSTGVVIIGNECNYGQNGQIEFWNMDGAVIEQNTGSNCGMGYEVWGAFTNGFIRYNKSFDVARVGTSNAHQNCIWFAPDTSNPGVTGNSTGNLVEYNLCYNAYGSNVQIEATNVGNTVRNNTMYLSTNGKVLHNTAGAGSATLIQNNIIVGASGIDLCFNSSGTTATYASNHYHQTSGSMRLNYNGTYHISATHSTAFSNFSAASGDGGQVGDPLFTSVVNKDMSLSSGSPAKARGVNYSSKRDINGYAIYNRDMGCIETRIANAVTVGASAA